MRDPNLHGQAHRAGGGGVRRAAARLVACAVIALGAGRASGQTAGDAAAAVVRVVCVTPTRAAAGGGVIVEAGNASSGAGDRVATSARLVACAGEGGRVAVGGRSGILETATVEWASPARDLAIVRTARPSGARAARLAAADVPDGADIRVVGFPGAGTVDATDRMGAALFVPTTVPGALIGSRRDDGALTRDTDAALTPGMRGGVLVNACGEVLGIVGEDGGAAGARLRILARAPFLDALRDRRIAADVSTVPCAAGAPVAPAARTPRRETTPEGVAGLVAGLPPWVWAVALGALLVALLPLLVRRRRPTSEPSDAAPVPPATPLPAAPLPAPVAAPPATSAPASFHLRGLPGVLGGVHRSLGERLRIGRDAARCDVVVPASASAVSKRHAVVFADAEGLWIQDGGSANGTFVAGRRIEPNRPVRLTRGARVHLATPDVAFVVE